MSAVGRAVAIAYAMSLACASPAVDPPTSGNAPRPGGRVVEAGIADITTLQPVHAIDLYSQRTAQKIYDTLWRADPRTGEILPNLGRWTVDPDGRTYRWEIETRANWSDGRPVVGVDYLTAVKAQARSKRTARKSNFQDIKGFAEYRDGAATAISGISVDGKSFAVTFLAVSCPALVNAFGPAAGPRPTHVFGKYIVDDDPLATLDDAPENAAPPVSSGPFLFKEWRRGDQVVLLSNAAYFRGAPLLDEYVFKVVKDSSAVAQQLRTGELDIGAVSPSDVAQIENDPRLQVRKYDGLRYTYVGWNLRSQTAPALSDRRVRQALAHGLDVDAVIAAVLLGNGRRMLAHHLPSQWAYAPEGLIPYAYDHGRAEALLAEAGYRRGPDGYIAKEGRPFILSVVTNAGFADRAAFLQILAEQYRQIGVKVTIRTEASESLNTKILSGTLTDDAWINGWVLPLDPDPYSIWHSTQIPDPATRRLGNNATGFRNAAVDRAIENARSGNCATAERRKHYATFNRILNEEQPYNFGFMPLTMVAANGALRAFAPGPFNEWPEIERWWLAK